MKPKLKNKYRLPGDRIGDDLSFGHEIIRLVIFAAAIGALAFAMLGVGR